MTELYNVYCDESCHLEGDHQGIMALGAVWCPAPSARRVSAAIRSLKDSHGIQRSVEVKWVKVSPGRLHFYRDLVDLFFDNPDLHFRALVVPDKSLLDHTAFGQTHDDWYYKMYFDLLKVILDPAARYRIYLDYKDTHGGGKVARLHDVLCNNAYDFKRERIERVQIVRSHEVDLIQLCDLLLGIVSYANRDLSTSPAKLELVDHMRRRSGYQLTRSTLLGERKTNILRWRPTQPVP